MGRAWPQVDVRADAAGNGFSETGAEGSAGRARQVRLHPAVQPVYRRGDILDELEEEPRARAQGLDQLRQVRSEHRGGGQHRDRGRQAHHRRLMAGATHVLPRAWPRTTAWRRRGFRRAVTFYLLISPWLVGFILLGAVPLAGAFVMSFTNYDGLNLDYVRFVGTDNYTRAFGDADAQYALGRTLLLMAIVVPVGLALQLALALMVNQPIRFSNVFRTIFYLPYVVPVVAGVWIWKIFVDPTGGLLNALLGVVLADVNVRWLVEYPTAVLAL